VQSAVFDSAAVVDFPGDATDFLGFEEINLLRLTGPAPFTLSSLIIGPTTLSSTSSISMTLVGNLLGGGSLTTTFAGVSTATLETLNWANLTSVAVTTTNDAALDDIVLNPVPEPASLLLGAVAMAGGVRRLRRKQAN
jgi:hypothetical protein